VRNLLVVVVVLAMLPLTPQAFAKHRVGGGVHYWKTLESLEDEFDLADIDDSGVSYVASYQWTTLPFQLLKLEADLEIFPNGYAVTDELAWSPQAYAIIGTVVYAGLGVGVIYEGDWSDPFYALRVGLDLALLPGVLNLDINANYQAMEWEAVTDLETIDENIGTITFGAVARVTF